MATFTASATSSVDVPPYEVTAEIRYQLQKFIREKSAVLSTTRGAVNIIGLNLDATQTVTEEGWSI